MHADEPDADDARPLCELFDRLFGPTPWPCALVALDGRVLATNRPWSDGGATAVGACVFEALGRRVALGDALAARALAGLLGVTNGQLPRFTTRWAAFDFWATPMTPTTMVIVHRPVESADDANAPRAGTWASAADAGELA